MGRILAIDYGLKRCGLAVTDPLKIIAGPLEMVAANQLLPYLKNYFSKEEVEAVVVGKPMDLFQNETDSTKAVFAFVEKLKEQWPALPVHLHDERFTSKMAQRAMIDGGMKKSKRREKGQVDKVSAVLILQSYMQANS
jgi:putative Holliday junction resolvase